MTVGLPNFSVVLTWCNLEKDICFSNYSISVFMVFYNLFSYEKTGGKQFFIQKTLFFFFLISRWELGWLSLEETFLVKLRQAKLFYEKDSGFL